MNNKNKTLSVIVLTIILFLIGCVLSLVVTCGIIKLITICFELKFKWSVAVGIWLIMCLLSTIFKSGSSK